MNGCQTVSGQAKRNHTPVNVDRQLRNPFVGILFCDKCGRIMKRNVPDKKRNLTLENKIKQLRESEEDLLKQKSEGKQIEVAHTQIIPTAQHILESYFLLTPSKKNRLWKLVLKKITIYRSPDDDITVRIHPNLPK